MYFVPNIGDFLGRLKTVAHDDLVDRLNYYVTPCILIFFMITISAKQYLGSPIQCWVPAQWRGGWEQYAEDYCFIQNTYSVPWDEDLPSDVAERSDREIGYYQWVPIILGLMTMLFYLPHFIWRTFSWQSGINIDSIVRQAKKLDADNNKVELAKLASQVQNALGTSTNENRWSRGRLWSMGHSVGCYVNVLYLFVKLLFVLNAFCQFFAMNSFLGTNNNWWGLHIFSYLVSGSEWVDSPHFPRVTMCDVTVRVLGQTHRNTIQCVLMINMFNEKIFLFLWFWILFTGLATACNLGYWLFTSLPFCQTLMVNREIRRARNYMTTGHGEDDKDSTSSTSDDIETARTPTMPHINRRVVERFTKQVLRSDGVLLMRFIQSHAGDMVVAQLTFELYKRYVNGSLRTADGNHDDRSDSEIRLLGGGTIKSKLRHSRRSMPLHSERAADNTYAYEEQLFNEKDTLPRTTSSVAKAGYPGPPPTAPMA